MAGRIHANVNGFVFIFQVVFEHDGVFIHPSDDSDSVEPYLLVSGSLRIMDKVSCITVVSGGSDSDLEVLCSDQGYCLTLSRFVLAGW